MLMMIIRKKNTIMNSNNNNKTQYQTICISGVYVKSPRGTRRRFGCYIAISIFCQNSVALSSESHRELKLGLYR